MKLASRPASVPKQVKKVVKEQSTKKRRSDKEIALVWLDEKLKQIDAAVAGLTKDGLADYADGRKVQEQHIRKIESLVNKRIAAYRKPIIRLFAIRGIE